MSGYNKRIRELVLVKLKKEYAFLGDKHIKYDGFTSAKHVKDSDEEDDEQESLKEFPQNWMQGRVSDTHTALGTQEREDNDEANFDTDNSGNPDLDNEEGEEAKKDKKDKIE